MLELEIPLLIFPIPREGKSTKNDLQRDPQVARLPGAPGALMKTNLPDWFSFPRIGTYQSLPEIPRRLAPRNDNRAPGALMKNA